MRLLGEWNWWLPSWLGWLPHVTIEGIEEPAPTGGEGPAADGAPATEPAT